MPSGSLIITRSRAEKLRKQGVKLSKKEAGSLGGQRTVKKHGETYMHNLAIRGADAFHKAYKLEKLGTSDFAIVERATGKPTGKTIRGLVLPSREWRP